MEIIKVTIMPQFEFNYYNWRFHIQTKKNDFKINGLFVLLNGIHFLLILILTIQDLIRIFAK